MRNISSSNSCSCFKENSRIACQQTSTCLSKADKRGHILCRISNAFRMKYTVTPGLYSVGNPGSDSPVFVTSNYKMSFNLLRTNLKSQNAYILVLDTKGINVWCAAGEGTFSTKELIKRIDSTFLVTYVNHREIIVPQLGAPGISAYKVKKETGFTVLYGPVRANDLPQYLKNSKKIEETMRDVQFTLRDRLSLIPMEIWPAIKKTWWIFLLYFIIMGIDKTGILFKQALENSLLFHFHGIMGLFIGTILVPILLPYIPMRAYTMKGFSLSVLITGLWLLIDKRVITYNPLLLVNALSFQFLISTYFAINFTGSTPFTNMSGVKKEIRFFTPFLILGIIIIVLLTVLYKISLGF